jgi:hypothetical protein
VRTQVSILFAAHRYRSPTPRQTLWCTPRMKEEARSDSAGPSACPEPADAPFDVWSRPAGGEHHRSLSVVVLQMHSMQDGVYLAPGLYFFDFLAVSTDDFVSDLGSTS